MTLYPERFIRPRAHLPPPPDALPPSSGTTLHYRLTQIPLGDPDCDPECDPHCARVVIDRVGETEFFLCTNGTSDTPWLGRCAKYEAQQVVSLQRRGQHCPTRLVCMFLSRVPAQQNEQTFDLFPINFDDDTSRRKSKHHPFHLFSSDKNMKKK